MTKQMTKTEQLTAIDTAIESMRKAIARHEACTLDDTIYAWPDLGLGVRWIGDKSDVTGLAHATAISTKTQGLQITNGKGEVAFPVRRLVVIKAYLPKLRDSLQLLVNHRAEIAAQAE